MSVDDQILRLYEDDNAFADYIGVDTYRNIRDNDPSGLNRLRNSVHWANVHGDDPEQIFNGYEEYSKAKGYTGDGDLDSRKIHDSLKKGWKDRHVADSLYEGYKSVAKSGWMNYEEGFLDLYQTSPSIRNDTQSLSTEINALKEQIPKIQDPVQKRLKESELKKNQFALRVQTIGRARAAEERLRIDIERQSLRFSESLLKLKAAEGLGEKIKQTGPVNLSQVILESMVSQGPGAPLAIAAGVATGPIGLGASSAAVAFSQEVAGVLREELSALNIDFTNTKTLDQQVEANKQEIQEAYVRAGKKAIPVAIAAFIGGKDFGGSGLLAAGARDLAAQTTLDAMGETLGQLWSTGDVDAAETYMEIIAGIGSNITEFGAKSTSALVTDKLKSISNNEDGSPLTSQDWEQVGAAVTDEEVQQLGLNPLEESAVILAKSGDRNAQDAIAQLVEDSNETTFAEKLGLMFESLAAAIERGGENVDKALQKAVSTSTRIRSISKKAGTRIERIDFDTTSMINDGVRRTDPFIDSVNRARKGLSPEDRTRLDLAIFSLDVKTLKEFGVNNIERLQEFLKERGSQFPEVNPLQIPNYFPRNQIDRKGFLEHIAKQEDGPFAEEIKKAEAKKGGPLTQKQLEVIVNSVIKRQGKGSKPGFLKARTIEEITPDILKFYQDPLQTLRAYNDRTADLIAKRQFLGEKIIDPENISAEPDIDTEAIARYIDEDLRGLTMEEDAELARLLASRLGFSRGHGTFQKMVNAYKTGVSLKYVSGLRTILIQASDLAMNWYANGIRDVVGNAISRKLFTDKFNNEVKATLDATGLDTLDQDLNEALKTKAKVTQVVLYGLRKMDFAMKQNLLSTFSHRWQRLSESSPAALKAELTELFEDDAFVNKISSDLKNKRLTADLSFAFFVKMSQYHPTGTSQMVKFFMDHPKARALGVLKSFAFKRFDLIYREVIADLNQGMTQSLAGAVRGNAGQVAAGAGKIGGSLGRLTKILSSMYVFETLIEMLYYQLTPDQEDDERKFLDLYLENVAGIVPFFNVWDFRRGLERGKIWEGLIGGIEPPSPIGADPLGEMIEAFAEDKPYDWSELKSEIPWVGAFLDTGTYDPNARELFE